LNKNTRFLLNAQYKICRSLRGGAMAGAVREPPLHHVALVFMPVCAASQRIGMEHPG